MLIYISHPYGGIEANKKEVEEIVERLTMENPQNTYISPIHAFGFLYETADYEQGLRYCLDLLARCDKMLVWGDYSTSKGCKREIIYCVESGIDFEIIK